MKLTDGFERASAQFFYSAIAGFFFTNAWYSLVSKLDKNADATLLNYGFADLNGDKIELEPQLEVNRFPIQLYHHVVSRASLRAKDVLEIGCGRGGGASYVARNLHPRRFVGLDINKRAIAFDQRFYKEQKNLQFIAGDAHAMPFREGVFDVALNVESSHHYNDMGRFLGEAHRVLKPGGSFLMACFPRKNEPSSLRESLSQSRFECTLEEDITPNVIRALELDSARREEAVLRLCPAPLRTFGREFAGIRGSKLYESFATGERRYLNFVLQKEM
jgi:ubiquinone/menaquinone biosynthesis C-methylase UbiE